MYVPDGLSVEADIVVADNDVMPMSFKFTADPAVGKGVMRGRGVKGALAVDFINFEASLSSRSVMAPQGIGTTDAGLPIWMICAIKRSPGMHRVEIQIVVGALSGGNNESE
jgi:hypothetical protein